VKVVKDKIMSNHAALLIRSTDEIKASGPQSFEANRSKTYLHFFDAYNSIKCDLTETNQKDEYTEQKIGSERYQKQVSTVYKKEDFVGVRNLFKSLPNYHALSFDKSRILSEGQMLVLSYNLPVFVKMCNWRLAFTLERDGQTIHNFFEKVWGIEVTLLVIEDSNGHKFGALCTSEWHQKNAFQGDSNSWVYTFHTGDDLQLWIATGKV